MKNDKMQFSLLYFAKNSVGRVGALNLDNVFKYTLFFGRYPLVTMTVRVVVIRMVVRVFPIHVQYVYFVIRFLPTHTFIFSLCLHQGISSSQCSVFISPRDNVCNQLSRK